MTNINHAQLVSHAIDLEAATYSLSRKYVAELSGVLLPEIRVWRGQDEAISTKNKIKRLQTSSLFYSDLQKVCKRAARRAITNLKKELYSLATIENRLHQKNTIGVKNAIAIEVTEEMVNRWVDGTTEITTTQDSRVNQAAASLFISHDTESASDKIFRSFGYAANIIFQTIRKGISEGKTTSKIMNLLIEN